MTLHYLADTSAIVRLLRATAAERWTEAVSAGIVGVCDPVELELLRGVGAGAHRRTTRAMLRGAFPWCPVPDNVWDRALDLQDQLADTSRYAGTSVLDLVVAMTAAHHRLTVLHDDRDYEVISTVTGLPVQRVTQ
jgi:predicted nucleic acid-binding protein